jgi:histone H3/H4
VTALREIKHYQSGIMADKLIIPKTAFTRVVREVLKGALEAKWGKAHAMLQKPWRIEADALVALQTMSEHIIVMVMEMWYVFSNSTLILVKSSRFTPSGLRSCLGTCKSFVIFG